jgi:GNAT superfamily N-acetyltransferase
MSVNACCPDPLTFVDMELRGAEPTDAIAVARVHVRSWQAAYRTFRPHTIVATESGDIRGFATTAAAQESNMSDYGELCALYVDPDHWGRGIGVALVSAARARLFDLGFRKAILWVLEGNVRAERFYRRDQWTPDGAQRTDEVWGRKVNDVRYRRDLELQERRL